MRPKTLKILALVFLILLLAASFPYWKPFVFKQSNTQPSDLSFSGIKESSVNKFSVKHGADEITLTKDNDRWKIASSSATAAVKNFFTDLEGLKIGELVSRNAENHQKFQVTEADGYVLTINNNGKEKIFIVGSTATSPDSFYARSKNSNNVYLVTGNIRTKIVQTASDWRDKIVLDIIRDNLTKIEVSGKSQLILTKNKDGKWETQISGKTQFVNDDQTNKLFAALHPLEAFDFLNDIEVKEFDSDKNKTVIKFTDDKNNTVAEITLSEKPNEWWGKVSNKEDLYKIATYKLTDVLLTQDKIAK